MSFGVSYCVHTFVTCRSFRNALKDDWIGRTQVSLEVELKRWRLTVNWETWLYSDCCCDIYPTRQLLPTPTVFGTHLIYEDCSPEPFDEFDDFSRISRLVEDSSDLPLF